MGYQAIVVEPQPESIPQLLALIVDHIDILLEDWYPTLGTRFVHTSEGKLLVTRLIPCPRCLTSQNENGEDESSNDLENNSTSKKINESSAKKSGFYVNHDQRQSQDSYKSDGDSGVGYDSSSTSSRMPSLEGHPDFGTSNGASGNSSNVVGAEDEDKSVYTWMVEECILAAYSQNCANQ